MIARVWHAKNPNWTPLPGDPEPQWPNDFKYVADVLVADGQRDAADVAFQLTNHFDRAWWENDGVRKVVAREVRSTSVGDVVVVEGDVFKCESVGWSRLPSDLAAYEHMANELNEFEGE